MPDKRRERRYYAALQQAVGLPDVSPTEPEPPDFLLVTDSTRLGIELTVFHLPPAEGKRPHQEQQSLKEHIVRLAEEVHARAGGPALYVGVHFNPRFILSKRDIQPLTQAIAESVLQAPMPSSMSEPVELPWGKRPRQTYGIQLLPSVDGADKLWHADAGGWVASITSKHIADVILAKSRTVQLARSRCDELWLVIVHDQFSRAAPSELTQEALNAGYTGPFDRIIWLQPHHPPRAIHFTLRDPAV